MEAGRSGIVHMDNVIDNPLIPTIQQDNAKTQQATRYGVRLFREYCSQHGVDAINNLPARDIARMLKGFYGQARTKDGQRFSVNSLIAIRYAISRFYRSPMVHRKIDIVKDNVFNEANETFRGVLKELERETRGTSCHKELQMVDMDDRRKLRHYFEHAISTPRGLLQKVWYDLMLRVGRRGRESQRLLNRSSFRIAKAADGRQYIYQVDDEEAGIIMEIPGDPLCPVKTLKFYLSRLNPACRALFQRPKEHVYEQDMCWYVNSPVGKNMLATMMSTISKCARLSRVYTNVRIRATTYSPADGSGCIPCTDVADNSRKDTTIPDKVEEKKTVESRSENKLPVSLNSQIIKQLNAPLVQRLPQQSSSEAINSVANSANPTLDTRIFPVALTLANPSSSVDQPSSALQKDEPRCVINCDWCKKEVKSLGGILLTSNEVGKEYCSTECLGKWIASEQPQPPAFSSQTNSEKSDHPEISNNISMQSKEYSSGMNFQKLLICSSSNSLPYAPSISTDYAGPQQNDASGISEAHKLGFEFNPGYTQDITDNVEKFRSTSPQLIVPDEVPPAAMAGSTVPDTSHQEDKNFNDTNNKKTTCDREVMCQPSMSSLAILCKPILRSQGIQTDFSTFVTSNHFMGKDIFPRFISTNGDCGSKDEELDESDNVEDQCVLNGDEFEYFGDNEDTSSLRMFVEEDDEVEDVPLPPPVKPEETSPQELLTVSYSHRGRTTKRTTWDEIAQRSKLQTLWGVKVFREWLQSRGSHRDFEKLEATFLANMLEEFYEHLTKPDGEEYSVSTMHTIRASISRFLTLPPQSKPFSIIRDREFKRANEAFYRRIRRLQSPRQPFQYTAGRTAIWQHQPSPTSASLSCNTNGIMLVHLGSR